MTMVFPDTKLIEVGEDVATNRSSLDEVERRIHLSLAPSGEVTAENQGHSVGRWTYQADTQYKAARCNVENAHECPRGWEP